MRLEPGAEPLLVPMVSDAIRSVAIEHRRIEVDPDTFTVEPGKCGGKPCIRGMRITVRRVLEILATYRDREEILRDANYVDSVLEKGAVRANEEAGKVMKRVRTAVGL